MASTKKSSRTAIRPPPRVVAVETVRPTAPNEPVPAAIDVYLHEDDEGEASYCKGYWIALWIALFIVFALALGAGMWSRNR
jgi:hypothetical protein